MILKKIILHKRLKKTKHYEQKKLTIFRQRIKPPQPHNGFLVVFSFHVYVVKMYLKQVILNLVQEGKNPPNPIS